MMETWRYDRHAANSPWLEVPDCQACWLSNHAKGYVPKLWICLRTLKPIVEKPMARNIPSP